MNKEKKGMNIFIRILSCFFSFVIPVIGTAMWLFYRKTDQKWARIYLGLCIAGFLFNYFAIDWLEAYTGINLG